MEAARDAQPAARVGDEIAHGFGLAGMIAGAVVGALVGAAVLAATAATGGLAIAIMGGAIAGGGVSVLQVVKGLSTVFDWPEPTTGKLAQGSPNVFINGRAAVRAGEDAASSCTGLALNHPMWPFQVTVAEGSATVFINGKPAARLGSKLACGAHIKTGSENVFIGGSTVSVAFVLDIEGWMKTGLEVLGLAAVATAADGQGQAVIPGEVDARNHVRHLGHPQHRRRPLVYHAVLHRPRLVVTRVAGRDDLPADLAAQALEVDFVHFLYRRFRRDFRPGR